MSSICERCFKNSIPCAKCSTLTGIEQCDLKGNVVLCSSCWEKVNIPEPIELVQRKPGRPNIIDKELSDEEKRKIYRARYLDRIQKGVSKTNSRLKV